MVGLNIVRIRNFEKYGYGAQEYGIANQAMAYNLNVMFNNIGINIAHGDYEPVPDSEFVFSCYKIYKKTYNGLVDINLKCDTW